MQLYSNNWSVWIPDVNHSLCPSPSVWLSLEMLHLHITCSQVSPRSHVLMCWFLCLLLSPSQSTMARSSCSLPQLQAHWVSKAASVLPMAVSVDSCGRLGELNCSPFKRVIVLSLLAAAPPLNENSLSASNSIRLLAGLEGCQGGEWKDAKTLNLHREPSRVVRILMFKYRSKVFLP